MPEALAPVITVDGPSGSGKGTVSQLVAQALGWNYLDSGALYRLVALSAERHDVSLTDEAALARLAAELAVCFIPDANAGASSGIRRTRIILEVEDVTAILRTETCGNAASQVAALPAVRMALVDRQRGFRAPPGLVADGRDMGSVIFTDSMLKVFLTASREERAARRYKQLKDIGLDATIAEIQSEIAERDARDGLRAVAPMKPAPDAIVIDTSRLEVKKVFERVMELWWSIPFPR